MVGHTKLCTDHTSPIVCNLISSHGAPTGSTGAIGVTGPTGATGPTKEIKGALILSYNDDPNNFPVDGKEIASNERLPLLRLELDSGKLVVMSPRQHHIHIFLCQWFQLILLNICNYLF